MNHKGTIQLETERLILRRFTIDDAPAMFKNWASDPEVTKFMTWPTHKDVGVNSIRAYYDPNNPHSGMVMKKCGMKYEGTLRSADRNNQGIVDQCWYSILHSEWEEL